MTLFEAKAAAEVKGGPPETLVVEPIEKGCTIVLIRETSGSGMTAAATIVMMDKDLDAFVEAPRMRLEPPDIRPPRTQGID